MFSKTIYAVSNKAFPYHQTVIDYLKGVLNVRTDELSEGLSDFNKRALANYIKGLKVDYNTSREHRVFRVNGLGNPANKHT